VDLGELPGDASDLLRGKEQKPVPTKERSVEFIFYGAKEIRFIRKALLQFACCGLGRFRRCRADIDENEIDSLRKGPMKSDFLLPPRQFGRKQIVDVGINRKMTRCVDGRNRGEKQRGHYDAAKMTDAVTHGAINPRLDHADALRFKLRVTC
jgi:hypothetical protein